MRRALPLTLCGLLALTGCAATAQPPSSPASPPPASQAAARREAAQASAALLVDQAAQTLADMRAASPHKMLDAALEGARALVILPGVYHAGFFYSAHVGQGVLLARRPDGGWGAPVFVGVAGAGYGLQVGLEKTRLVLAVLEEDMLERILDSGLHFDASAQYDILGVREEASRGSLTTGRPVEVFADGVGLMAGVALRGGVLSVSQGLTQDYYGPEAGGAQEIMRGTAAPGLEVFRLWNALVQEEPGPEIIRSDPGR